MANSNPNSNSTPFSTDSNNVSPKTQQSFQISSLIKAYWLPATLFSLFFVFQLVLLPKSFPPSHYDALGVERQSSIVEVKQAYEGLASKWNSGAELPATSDFIKIRYAYELLTNPLWKRDYDLFGTDEHQHLLEDLTRENSGKEYSTLILPLLDVVSVDTQNIDFSFLSSDDLYTILRDPKPSLIQIYSNGSKRSREFASKWKKIATLLGEIADTGVVELGDFKLASLFAEKKATGQLFYRNGLPSLFAFPPGCHAFNCLVRYDGELSVDAVTDWFSTTILNLPRIPYYTKDSLGPRFLAKSSYHKVKVMFFSDTGMRATPFVRQLAKKYQDYASFACVLWKEEDYSTWWTIYGVESAPATAFLKDPGTKPLVYYGSVNSSWFVNVMEDNKVHELPQLRSMTSMLLGCDARGYSRAGSSTNIWYCAILVGRPSLEMNQMREVLRKVQQTLSDKIEHDSDGIDVLAAPSIVAFKKKRLTLAWMDGEVQKNLCMFYVGEEISLQCCGPSRGIEDTPQLVMVRYMRNDSITETKEKRASNSLLHVLQDDVDPVSQLVARYTGSTDPVQIMEWISKIIEDGDSAKLPFYKTNTPELVPENADPLWSFGSGNFASTGEGIKLKIQKYIVRLHHLSGDPRIGPMLLLGALISFGGIWVRRSQPISSHGSRESQENQYKDDIPKEWRNRRISPSTEVPPSMTDMEPKDAYQMGLSDSDNE